MTDRVPFCDLTGPTAPFARISTKRFLASLIADGSCVVSRPMLLKQNGLPIAVKPIVYRATAGQMR